MKARFFILALFVAAAGLSGAATRSAQGQSAAPQVAGNVVVQDTWYGVSFERNYRPCDAVAVVLVSGNYDMQKLPNGDLAVSLGLTGEKQRVEVNIDGLHRHCFG